MSLAQKLGLAVRVAGLGTLLLEFPAVAATPTGDWKIEPATGRDGRPAKSAYEQTITWQVTD